MIFFILSICNRAHSPHLKWSRADTTFLSPVELFLMYTTISESWPTLHSFASKIQVLSEKL